MTSAVLGWGTTEVGFIKLDLVVGKSCLLVYS